MTQNVWRSFGERLYRAENHVFFKRWQRGERRRMRCRNPTTEERKQLAEWITRNWGRNPGHNKFTVQYGAYIAVFPDYMASPYIGKVIVVIFDGSPGSYYVWTWRNGELQEEDREGCVKVKEVRI